MGKGWWIQQVKTPGLGYLEKSEASEDQQRENFRTLRGRDETAPKGEVADHLSKGPVELLMDRSKRKGLGTPAHQIGRRPKQLLCGAIDQADVDRRGLRLVHGPREDRVHLIKARQGFEGQGFGRRERDLNHITKELAPELLGEELGHHRSMHRIF